MSRKDVSILVFCLACAWLQPNFGASLQILKVEIGGDSQASGKFVLIAENSLL